MRKALACATALVLPGVAAAQVAISPSSNLQAAINANPGGTVFDLAPGTYTGGQWLAKSNDQFIGPASGPAAVFDGQGVQQNLTYDNGATGVTLANVTVQRFANPLDTGPIHGVQGWTISNVTSQNNAAAGIVIGAGTTIQGGSYINNGQIGIEGSHADNATVTGATIAGNNTGNYAMDYAAGGMKFGSSADVTVSDNGVSNNKGSGIWFDIDSTGAKVSDNLVVGNAAYGIQYEISHGGTITGNGVSGNKTDIVISNSDGTSVIGNYLPNGDSGVQVINADRGSGLYGVWQSVNNTISGNSSIAAGASSAAASITAPPVGAGLTPQGSVGPAPLSTQLQQVQVQVDQQRAADAQLEAQGVQPTDGQQTTEASQRAADTAAGYQPCGPSTAPGVDTQRLSAICTQLQGVAAMLHHQ